MFFTCVYALASMCGSNPPIDILVSPRTAAAYYCLVGLTTSCKLVINLLLKEHHLLARQLMQNAERALPAEEAVEARVAAGVVFRATEYWLSLRVYFLYTRSARCRALTARFCMRVPHKAYTAPRRHAEGRALPAPTAPGFGVRATKRNLG